MDRVYGSDSFGIVSPAAIMQAQKHTQAGGATFTFEGWIHCNACKCHWPLLRLFTNL